MMTIVFLPTDICFYILWIFLAVLIYFNCRKAHLRRIWKKVFSSKLAVASATLLMVFFGIALLDSIHFRLSNTTASRSEMVSVLDLIISPLDETYETTYSAPFSSHASVKSNITLPDDTVAWQYEKLTYPKQLNTSEKIKDIAFYTLKSLLIAVVLWTVVFFLYRSIYSYFAVKKTVLAQYTQKSSLRAKRSNPVIINKNTFPHRFFLGFLLLVLFSIILAFELSRGYHIFGTTKVGQDVFYQAVKSIRTGVLIGTLTTLFMVPLSIIFGISAGYFGGIIDDIIQYVYTTLSSIPGILLIAASVLSLEIFFSQHPEIFNSLAQQADARLLVLCLILGVTSWTDLCRLLRAETLKVREYDYITAAKALGVRSPRIITRHILPNVMHIIIITMVLDFSGLVLAEAVLSYVGAGVDPNMLSWGNMINSARLEMARTPAVWWPLLSAFVFMFTLVLAANVFSEKVREAFDPRVN